MEENTVVELLEDETYEIIEDTSMGTKVLVAFGIGAAIGLTAIVIKRRTEKNMMSQFEELLRNQSSNVIDVEEVESEE